jgi:hypothetical protein
MRHGHRPKYWIICISLLLTGLPQIKAQVGQASNAIKARRMAAYNRETLIGWGTYGYLIATYQKQNAQAVGAFLQSLGVRYRFPKKFDHVNFKDPFPDAVGKGKNWPRIQVRPDQGVFVLPGWPGEDAWGGDTPPTFANSDIFKMHQAVVEIAKSPLIDDFLFTGSDYGLGLPMSGCYDINPAILFDDPSHPTPDQALSHVNRVLGGFFGQYGGRVDLYPNGANPYSWKLAVRGMHGAVLENIKDAERLDGDVDLAPRLGTTLVDLEIYFTGESAPKPFNQPPPDARYVKIDGKKLEDFADVLTKYLREHFSAKATEKFSAAD